MSESNKTRLEALKSAYRLASLGRVERSGSQIVNELGELIADTYEAEPADIAEFLVTAINLMPHLIEVAELRLDDLKDETRPEVIAAVGALDAVDVRQKGDT